MAAARFPQILLALDREERRLFTDRIRLMDRRIMPGVAKLTWLATTHQVDHFYKEARKVRGWLVLEHDR